MTKYPIVSNQVLYNLKRREIERELLPYRQESDVTIMACTPLASGSLAFRPRLPPDRGMTALRAIASQRSARPWPRWR